MKQSFVAQFAQLLKCWLCDVQLGVVGGELSAFVDQCRLQALPFSVHLIHLLSILLKYNGFARIQKAVVDQTVSKPLNSDHDPFFGTSLALESALEPLLSPTSKLVIAGCCIQSTFHRTSQSN